MKGIQAAYDRTTNVDTATPANDCIMDIFRRSALDVLASDKRSARSHEMFGIAGTKTLTTDGSKARTSMIPALLKA